MGIDESLRAGVLERGHLYFFYRPRVEHEEAHSINDISRCAHTPKGRETTDLKLRNQIFDSSLAESDRRR